MIRPARVLFGYATTWEPFRQGDRGDRLYIIMDGEAEIVRQEPGRGEETLARLGPGECIGEMAVVSDRPRHEASRA